MLAGLIVGRSLSSRGGSLLRNVPADELEELCLDPLALFAADPLNVAELALLGLPRGIDMFSSRLASRFAFCCHAVSACANVSLIAAKSELVTAMVRIGLSL